MTIEDIVNEIEEGKKTQIEKIRSDFLEREKELNQVFQKEIEDLRAEYARKTENEIRSMESREKDLADLEARRIILEKKSDLVSQGVDLIRNALMSFPSDAAYQDFLDRCAAEAKKALGDVGTLKCRKEDFERIKSLFGAKCSLVAGEMSGGFIAVSSSGKMEIDFTLENIFSEMKPKIEQFVMSRIGES